MKINCLLILLLLSPSFIFSQTSYQKAWEAINNNDRGMAEKLLESAVKEPQSAVDAFITQICLKNFNGRGDEITGFTKEVYDKAPNPYPYIYALWFSKAILGEYGKKTLPHQLEIANRLIKDEKAPGCLRASANYQMGHHHAFSAQFDEARPFYQQIGSIRNWQYTGPFENISESGFYKTYAPILHPEPEANFKTLTGAPIKWFTPSFENGDGWIPISGAASNNTAISYAQTFVNLPEAKEVIIGLGFSGSIKLWVNDHLIISESRELVTDYDSHSAKYTMPKGVSRILVQLGYTNNYYPNFVLRINDKNNQPIPGINGSTIYKPYVKNETPVQPDLLPQFAEQYFSQKIAADSSNLVNYLLLSGSYSRSRKMEQAREVINKALERAPRNGLLITELIDILKKQGNETLLQAEIDKLKEYDSSSLPAMNLVMDGLLANEQYADLETKLEQLRKLYKEDEKTIGYEAVIIARKNNVEDIVNFVEKIHQRYPENAKYLEAMYNIKMQVDKNPDAALGVYENFLKNNYNAKVYLEYSKALLSQGKKERFVSLKAKMIANFPYISDSYVDLADYFLLEKQYQKSEDMIRKALSLNPTNASYWKFLGDVKNQQHQYTATIAAYNQSLQYEPHQYDLIANVRKLEGKPESYKLFTTVDENKFINEDRVNPESSEYGYYFLLDKKDVIVYENGSNEKLVTILIKITNEKGVERYKEISLPENNQQKLTIEKAEIVKNGRRIQAERNGTDVVFTNLEPNDVIFVRYKLQQFGQGRFAKEFTDKFCFDGYVYCAASSYSLVVPNSLKFDHIFSKQTIQPVITQIEQFKKYTWEKLKCRPIDDEPSMPPLVDVGNSLYISTIAHWSQISGWYKDIVNYNEDNYEIKQAYKAIFPTGKTFSNDFDKAKQIYNYIESNIRYSSVAFRQSAYVPQKASATLTTRLGDCKDLSKLFVTFCDMAGITANMVLVDTRENGEKDILQPGMEFNHCIAKAKLDGKEYFIELTDNNLPFAALPYNLHGAIILEIPHGNASVPNGITLLKSNNRKTDHITRNIEMKLGASDIDYKVHLVRAGALSAYTRSDFRHINDEKRLKLMQENVAAQYASGAQLKTLDFSGLNTLDDSTVSNFSFTAKDQISEIGSIGAFKVKYQDEVATLDNFSAETRKHPFEYWSYETADSYETNITVVAPSNKIFFEIPESQNFSFKNIKYTIQFKLLAPDKLFIKRTFSNDRPTQIPAGDYAELKSLFQKIIKIEQKFITIK